MLSVLNFPIVRSYLVSHTHALYQWRDRVQDLFPALQPHHRRSLADYAFGMALTGCCGLSTVVARLALLVGGVAGSLKARLRELYLPADAQKGSARSTFDYTLCFGPLVRWAAAGQPERRLALALDPTCLTGRFRVLCVSVLYRGGGLPVAWAVQLAADRGSWNDVWKDLLGQLKQALGEGWGVLVLTDRGLESADLFRAITELGWHPLMRVKAGGRFRPLGWRRGHTMAQFACAVGRRWAGRGEAYPATARLPCTLLASWEADHEEAWLVLTDLSPAGTDVAWYAWRMWCELGYRAVKRGQWGWHKTQMSAADRAARLWAVVALATLWAVDVGREAEVAPLPKVPKMPELSLLTWGLLLLSTALMRGEPLPMPQHRLTSHPWPQRTWLADLLSEDMMNTC